MSLRAGRRSGSAERTAPCLRLTQVLVQAAISLGATQVSPA